jgi:predicted nucleotidyltransferase
MKGEKLSETLFGKTRRAVLSILYGHAEDSFYLRQLARMTGVGMGALQRELRQLSEAGIIRQDRVGRQIFFKANPECPIFEELRSLVIKTFGVADLLREALSPLAGRIRLAFIFGSVARGEPSRGSDIDVMVIGNVTLRDIVGRLGALQEKLSREINPVVYPVDEFRSKVSANDHFLNTVIKEAKDFLIGDSDELERLGRERLASPA